MLICTLNESGRDMRSEHSRVAFAALDKLIDSHYIMDMRKRELMETIYILIYTNLETGYRKVINVYDDQRLAQDSLEY